MTDTDPQEQMAVSLAQHFAPETFNDAYVEEYERSGMKIPPPAERTCMVTFQNTDGYLSIKPLNYGEIAEALHVVGYRRVVADDETVGIVSAVIHETDCGCDSWDCRNCDAYPRNEIRSEALNIIAALRGDQ